MGGKTVKKRNRFWVRKKPGFYQLMEKQRAGWRNEEKIVTLADVVRGAEGMWWLEMFGGDGRSFKRCASRHNAQGIAEECT
jgi:hypothetical protein